MSMIGTRIRAGTATAAEEQGLRSRRPPRWLDELDDREDAVDGSFARECSLDEVLAARMNGTEVAAESHSADSGGRRARGCEARSRASKRA